MHTILLPKGFLKYLQLEFLKKYPILIQPLYINNDITFYNWSRRTYPDCSWSYLIKERYMVRKLGLYLFFAKVNFML